MALRAPADPVRHLPSGLCDMMRNVNEHDHREEESLSEEEVEETKPKSALKKGREVLPPVQRPELPYVFSHLPS